MKSINKLNVFFSKYRIIISFLLIQVIIFILLYTSFFTQNETVKTTLYFGMFAFCLLSYFVLYRIFVVINEQSKLEAESALLSEQRKIQNEYLYASRENREKFYQIRDRIYNELQQEKNKYDEVEARKKALSIMEECSDLYNIDYCENKIIDAILYNKLLLAKKNNIKTSVQVLIPNNLPIKNIDLMFVFTNLIDNAIEACTKLAIDKRYIDIEGMKKANYLVIKVANSKSPDINVKKDSPSSKEDSENHGLGLKIIQKCCKQNHGHFQIDDHNDWIEICVTLALDEVKS